MQSTVLTATWKRTSNHFSVRLFNEKDHSITAIPTYTHKYTVNKWNNLRLVSNFSLCINNSFFDRFAAEIITWLLFFSYGKWVFLFQFVISFKIHIINFYMSLIMATKKFAAYKLFHTVNLTLSNFATSFFFFWINSHDVLWPFLIHLKSNNNQAPM